MNNWWLTTFYDIPAPLPAGSPGRYRGCAKTRRTSSGRPSRTGTLPPSVRPEKMVTVETDLQLDAYMKPDSTLRSEPIRSAFLIHPNPNHWPTGVTMGTIVPLMVAVADPGGGGRGVWTPPPFVARCRLSNIGPKIGPPSGPPLFCLCVLPNLDPPPLSKILDPPLGRPIAFGL